VPAFRDLPAALDSEPPLIAFPDPLRFSDVRRRRANAYWRARNSGDDGRFALVLVTEDDEQHFITPSAASMSALLAPTQVDAAQR
jgi:hypothetical protein